MANKQGVDFIRINRNIKVKLHARFEELAMTRKEVCLDAKERGYTIQQSAISKYFNNEKVVPGSLTQEQVIWLCCRYCIPIKVSVVNMDMNEIHADKLLKMFF